MEDRLTLERDTGMGFGFSAILCKKGRGAVGSPPPIGPLLAALPLNAYHCDTVILVNEAVCVAP